MTIRVSVLDREYVTVCPSLVQLAKVRVYHGHDSDLVERKTNKAMG